MLNRTKISNKNYPLISNQHDLLKNVKILLFIRFYINNSLNIILANIVLRNKLKPEILKARLVSPVNFLNMKIEIIKRSIGLQHPSVQRVLEIAQELLNQNKVLNIENLYNLAKRRLKLPRNGLLNIIQFLINKKVLIEGSKFSKKNVLTNNYRKKIFNYINTYPGIHFSLLKKRALSDSSEETGSSGQLIWHLEMLLRFDFIKKTKVGHYTVFLPSDMGEEEGKLIFLLRDEINNKILHLLTEQDLTIKSEVYKDINEKREDVYYRIKNLIDQDIISLDEETNKELSINSNLKEILLKILKESKMKKLKT
ncbi:MAG: hypothetical protein ACFFB0_19965 [Promethearchaeota archaeon]